MNLRKVYNTLRKMIWFSNVFIPVLLHAQIGFKKYNQVLKESNQVVFVTANNWNASHGLMQLYQRPNAHSTFKLQHQFAVTLGRNGLAFDGRSVLPKPVDAAIKQEGDGKSPAGIFPLGPVFSYHVMNDLKMPFKKVDTLDICVDDVHSAYYAKLVSTDTAMHKDFNSFEHMRASDDSYEYGVWVRYNSDKIFAGDGSCIFLHVWAGENSSTAGCTAMEKQNILTLIHWLDIKQKPVLLQIVDKE